jgi:hypothetical protein
MATEFDGDLYDIGNMTDDELRSVVIEHLREQTNLDADQIDVIVRAGRVTLEGRVGTDDEYQVAGETVDDLLGIDDYSNNLLVDPLYRGHEPVAADESAVVPGSGEDDLGGSDLQQSDTAEHLVEDIESETLGTHDTIRAIRDASAYSPPDNPVGDGYGSRENH